MKKIITTLLLLSLLLPLAGCSNKKTVTFDVITDLHFAGEQYYKYVGEYEEANDSGGSGKQMRYLDTILDIFVEQIKNEKPEYLLVTGDFVYVGAKQSHQELVKVFEKIKENGTQVLVLPGNHDMQRGSFIAPDGNLVETETLEPNEFKELYADYGLGNNISMDEKTMSYVYDTGKGTRFFMLDTNIFYGQMYGKVAKETLSWLEQQLYECQKAKDHAVVASHHILLNHNPQFAFGYQLNNTDDVVALLKKYNVSLYFSGHIHTQSIVHDLDNNVTDITNESFAVWPHRYGTVTMKNDGSWVYDSKFTDVEGYAKENGLTDENLLNYNEYGFNYYYNQSFRQAMNQINGLTDEETAKKLADFAARANVLYFSGEAYNMDKTLLQDFLDLGTQIRWHNYILNFINDPTDHLHAEGK